MGDDARGIIVVAVVVTATTTAVVQAKQGAFHFRPYFAASVLGILLSGLAMVNTQLARNFAMLVILVALLRNGSQTLSFASGATTPKKIGA